jgi:hypothetical protein
MERGSDSMKTKRRVLPPRQLAAENAAITQFLFDCAKPYAPAKLPLGEFFGAYMLWRKRNQMKPTALNIDGFGRLFPHAYPRKSSYWPPAKHALKCVFGLVLTEKRDGK